MPFAPTEPVVFEQKQGPRMRLRVEIGAAQILLTERTGQKETRREVPLLSLSPYTEETREYGNEWGFGLIFLAAMFLPVPVLEKGIELGLGRAAAAMAALLAAAGVTVLGLLLRRRSGRDFLLIYDMRQQEPVLRLRLGGPGCQEVESFAETLLAATRDASAEWYRSGSAGVPTAGIWDEIEAFHRLKGEGVLSEEELHTKKTALLREFLEED